METSATWLQCCERSQAKVISNENHIAKNDFKSKHLVVLAKIKISHLRIVLKTLQFLNYCRSRINRIKQQKLALPLFPTLDSYNGRQLIH